MNDRDERDLLQLFLPEEHPVDDTNVVLQKPEVVVVVFPRVTLVRGRVPGADPHRLLNKANPVIFMGPSGFMSLLPD